MHYRTNDDLPDSVKNNLPPRAQGIYRRAYNDAWSRFSYLAARGGDQMLREENAHEAGWRAVRAQYKRRDGRWVLVDQSGSFDVGPRRSNAAE